MNRARCLFVLIASLAMSCSGETVPRGEAIAQLVEEYCGRLFECSAGEAIDSAGLCDGGGTSGEQIADRAACVAYMNGTDCVLDASASPGASDVDDGDAFAACLQTIGDMACADVTSDGVWEDGGVLTTSNDCASSLGRTRP